MKTFARMLVLCLVMPAGVALAQDKPAVTPQNPLSTWNKMAYTRVKDILAVR